jgi:hypothetical protein
MVVLGELHVVHVPTHLQYAYIMTKELPQVIFNKFEASLHVGDATAQRLRRGGWVLRFDLYSILSHVTDNLYSA